MNGWGPVLGIILTSFVLQFCWSAVKYGVAKKEENHDQRE